MNENDILVVRVNILMKDKYRLEELRERLLKEKKEGVILLPSYCSAIIAPKDVEIKVEDSRKLQAL